jgi:hypothetical protein
MNLQEVDTGTCPSETLKLDILLDSEVTHVYIGIPRHDDDSLLAQCYGFNGSLLCVGEYVEHNKSSNILTLRLTFDYPKYAGETIRINSTFSNRTVMEEAVLLKACSKH